MGLIVKDYIGELRERLKEQELKVKETENVISAIQNICRHDFEINRSVGSVQRCRWCGYEKKA